ncbi:MAG: hypothetical protein AAGA56_29890, partial [Myxococcota bacterium]
AGPSFGAAPPQAEWTQTGGAVAAHSGAYVARPSQPSWPSGSYPHGSTPSAGTSAVQSGAYPPMRASLPSVEHGGAPVAATASSTTGPLAVEPRSEKSNPVVAIAAAAVLVAVVVVGGVAVTALRSVDPAPASFEGSAAPSVALPQVEPGGDPKAPEVEAKAPEEAATAPVVAAPAGSADPSASPSSEPAPATPVRRPARRPRPRRKTVAGEDLGSGL